MKTLRTASHYVYARDYADLILVDLETGKRSMLYSVKGGTTVTYEGGGSERETISPVGFNADNTRVYFIRQQSSVFVGGNELHSIDLAGGGSTLEDKGMMDAAISQNGDLAV